MAEAPDPETLLDLFGDEYVRTIVRAASREPMSVKELSEECGSARSTVYRRVDDLVDAGVLLERTRLEAGGSHHSVYETSLETLTVSVEDGRYEVDLEGVADPAERFTSMWRDLRGLP